MILRGYNTQDISEQGVIATKQGNIPWVGLGEELTDLYTALHDKTQEYIYAQADQWKSLRDLARTYNPDADVRLHKPSRAWCDQIIEGRVVISFPGIAPFVDLDDCQLKFKSQVTKYRLIEAVYSLGPDHAREQLTAQTYIDHYLGGQ